VSEGGSLLPEDVINATTTRNPNTIFDRRLGRALSTKLPKTRHSRAPVTVSDSHALLEDKTESDDVVPTPVVDDGTLSLFPLNNDNTDVAGGVIFSDFVADQNESYEWQEDWLSWSFAD
jgi:hypothetical protein